ncbi:recombinase family protein [Streptomyces hygroscopicus]|uniref:recombinase family protein n=1 Tax=Streptomyces hygroscopicus TaxID=1912 RepID=UPI0007675FCE|nr:recombinase family protein [Streptomyces hygroscopicus]
MSDGILLAREYRRLSDKKGGTSLEDQGEDNKAAADENDWDLGEPYIDDGLSASRYARKRRDDFDQLVADLESGPTGRESRFGADILMLWESSRGSRRVGEWVSFIELCETKRVRIWVTTHERLYDPANGRDRKALIDDAVDSEYESYKTHRRVSRTAPREARRGRPHGKAPYGLMPVYDVATGKLITWTADPDRAHVIQELFERLEEGHSFAAIERAFLLAGYLNKSGRPFTHGHLRRLAVTHAYAGLRYYKGTVYEGTWDGIVPRPRFWNVYRLVTDSSRITTSRTAAAHALTAGLWCGRCDTLLSFRMEKERKPVYRCKQCGIKIQRAPVDELIIGKPKDLGILLAYLARDDIYDVLRAPGSDDAAVREVRDDLARLRAERDELRNATGATLAEVRLLANSLQVKEAEVSALEARERELTVPASVLSIVQPGLDVWQSWRDAPIGARRATVRLIMSPRYLGRACILPSPRPGRNQVVAERLEWRHTNVPSPVPRWT